MGTIVGERQWHGRWQLGGGILLGSEQKKFREQILGSGNLLLLLSHCSRIVQDRQGLLLLIPLLLGGQRSGQSGG